MSNHLSGHRRIALVTGGGAGIGRATCLRLAQQGRSVAVLGRREDNVGAVVEEIRTSGGEAFSVVADVADGAQVSNAVDIVRQQAGPISILVNNAGIENFTPFMDIEEAEWNRQIAVNLNGVYHMIRAVLPDMLTAKWGRIVNITALGAQIGAANMVHYTATKGAVASMTRSLAVELGSNGITVNAVSPGFILTPMSQRAIDSDLFGMPPEDILASYPIPRIGQPEEVAAACAFFASDEASYITAQTLGVNGGCCP